MKISKMSPRSDSPSGPDLIALGRPRPTAAAALLLAGVLSLPLLMLALLQTML